MSFQSLFGDIFEASARVAGRKKDDGPRWEGVAPSDEFFAAARHGDSSALNTLKDKYYGTSWKRGFHSSVEAEMWKGADRGFFRKIVPRGALTGYKHYGLGRAAATVSRGSLKVGGLMALPFTALAMGSAERGKMGNALVKSAGETVGGFAGAAAGAFLLGLPGELIGGWAGSEIGGLIEKPMQMAQDYYKQSHHLNFGGDYQDTEAAYTQRQRAVQEMGRSALNARQWPGKEALLLHS